MPEEQRSSKSRDHQFAEIGDAWPTLPERLAERFPTAESLRKYALIKTGFAPVMDHLCGSHAEAGRPSIALAFALQFELGLRREDVIGERIKPSPEARAAIVGAITDGAWAWEWGLTWGHIDASQRLAKPTSKSNGAEIAEHDLRLHSDIIAEPPPRGLGPIVLDERSGLPWKKAPFSRTFREIARAAGWPDAVWNMDSRAGAVSEAFEAGADPADVMRTANHRQMSTTMLHNCGGLARSGRVTELRAARRGRSNEPET